uniref:Uncharacterized protein n=1 Tax=Anguilla anguilla TaxID=7936 RepID=A0A0E9UG00_ANGAN
MLHSELILSHNCQNQFRSYAFIMPYAMQFPVLNFTKAFL